MSSRSSSSTASHCNPSRETGAQFAQSDTSGKWAQVGAGDHSRSNGYGNASAAGSSTDQKRATVVPNGGGKSSATISKRQKIPDSKLSDDSEGVTTDSNDGDKISDSRADKNRRYEADRKRRCLSADKTIAQAEIDEAIERQAREWDASICLAEMAQMRSEQFIDTGDQPTEQVQGLEDRWVFNESHPRTNWLKQLSPDSTPLRLHPQHEDEAAPDNELYGWDCEDGNDSDEIA